MTTIKLFGLALKGNNFDYKTLSELALKNGYLVDESCSTTEVYEFLKSIKINTSTTFYKQWSDITSKNREELFLDQALHYLTTYGTDHTSEKVYIPNDEFGVENTCDFSTYKVIKSATQEEIIEKCNDMLRSGIPLSEETLEDLFEIYDRFFYVPNIDIVKNKEAKMRICLQKNILPKTNEEFIRFLVFLATEKTLLIKDRKTLEMIKKSGVDISEKVKQYGIEKLSQSFLRYKDLFLAFKKCNEINSYTVNKLRKLAIKNHKPYKKSFFEGLLESLEKGNAVEMLLNLSENLGYINNFKKVALIEMLRNKIHTLSNKGNDSSGYKSYIIRNGKFFIKKDETLRTEKDVSNYITLEKAIMKNLIDSVKEKLDGKTFFIPDHIDIKLPKSEKTFIGNIPFGTSISLKESDLVLGINWTEENVRDLDLSFISETGKKFGWDSNYRTDKNNIIYSGDMTSANPQATELLFFAHGENEDSQCGVVKVNNYSGEKNSKFHFIIGKNTKYDESFYKSNKMLEKNNILFNGLLETEYKESILGVKLGDKFVIQRLISGDKRVSGDNSVTQAYMKYARDYYHNFISLKEFLLSCGAVESKDKKDGVDYDFEDIQKDTIINILSK